MTTIQNFGAYLSNKQAVYDACKRMGFVQTRGKDMGEGSPRKLLEAIGQGAIIILVPQPEQVTETAAEVTA